MIKKLKQDWNNSTPLGRLIFFVTVIFEIISGGFAVYYALVYVNGNRVNNLWLCGVFTALMIFFGKVPMPKSGVRQ